mgnify:CR=1 FL=1
MHTLERKQFLPMSLKEAWDFFSSPKNLKEITPDYMGFNITSDPEDVMYQGMIISYIVSPVLNIPITWVTEIKHVIEPHYFVDEQRFGPYTFWHHKHYFKEVEGGVEMRDVVHYELPYGILGNLAHSLFVKSQLNEIFDYRHEKLEKIFGTIKSGKKVDFQTAQSA